ncbi:MAG: hypothetical protein WAW36_14375 [Methylovulum miyakonense]|uniref:hypothetical protein n=1 Tax=Methylovulum miyakonense TaxID=645578 RepID=UPI003BB7BBD8
MSAHTHWVSVSLLAMAMMVVVPGCSSFGCCMTVPVAGKGSVHYLILGVGLVTVPKPEHETAILATQSHALGINLSDQPGMKLGVGYTSGSVVAIPDHAKEVRVEINQRPGGGIIINAPKAELKQP